MRRPGIRRQVAVAVLTAVAVVGVTACSSDQSTTAPPDAGDGAAVSLTVTVPDGQFGTAAAEVAPTAGTGTARVTTTDPDPLLDGAVGDRDRIESWDERDYTVPPTPEAADLDGSAQVGARWPAPPIDPTASITVAVAAAEAVGVHQAVVVVDRSTGAVLTQLNSDEPFPALSLVKVMIAADVIDGAGTVIPADDATVAWMAEMISTSDDVTAADFYQQAGADELVNRVVERYGLTGSSPTPDGEYWGNIQTTAADMASLLNQLLTDPGMAAVLGPAMVASTAIAADGVDQRFGMRTVPGAGSKQGWGCCLSGVVGIHSVGFTPERIVVVLSDAETDDESLGAQDGLALQADPGAQVSIAAVTETVRAALGGPSS